MRGGQGGFAGVRSSGKDYTGFSVAARTGVKDGQPIAIRVSAARDFLQEDGTRGGHVFAGAGEIPIAIDIQLFGRCADQKAADWKAEGRGALETEELRESGENLRFELR